MPEFELSLDYLKALADAYIVPFGINLLVAIAVFVIGKMVVNVLVNMVSKVTTGRLDDSLRSFLTSVLRGILLAVVAIAALERLGVQTTAAVAILGAAGLAIGFALQGSLGNFASGVMIIIFRPYKLGDLVKLAGHVGVVEGIEVFNTVILTPDNRTIIIPNGQVGSTTIENLSAKGNLRIDMVFGIGYGDDIKKAKDIMQDILSQDSRVLSEPAPQVAVSELGDSSVNFVVRPWVKVEDYWDVRFDLHERIKIAFDENGVSIPFPQRDVHLHNVA
ncbi:MAG: mechanosensitive ion channel [Kofleriaceae bacterium]|nr:mechanosensitive ion channel [Kofleriaceae bacterium]